MTYDDAFRNNLIEGMTKFQGARSRAFWSEVIALLSGKSTELLSFEDVKTRLRLREESYKGLQEVPLAQIGGSVGRYRDFTASFLPRSNAMKERWSRVYAQATGMTGLPPIELYKVGEVYFVRDGNHRVSVARQLGSKTIQAHVTELPTAVPIRAGMSADELDGATAYAAFLEESEVSRVRPHHQPMNLSERSRYADLMGHIYTHKYVMEQVSRGPVNLGAAAANWYDNIYRPAVTLIRKYGIMNMLPGRTEGDLYLWMVDHLREVQEQYGDAAPVRRFSQALVDFLDERGIEVPTTLQEEDDPSMLFSRRQIDVALRRRHDTAPNPPDTNPPSADG